MPAALCLFALGALQWTLPADHVVLAWEHSVEKIRWEETYRVEACMLKLTHARVEGSGAGMEAGPDATWRAGGWEWSPDTVLPALVLAASDFGGDYVLCVDGRCDRLATLVPQAGAPVTLRPCGCSGRD